VKPKFFATPAALRQWFERNHARADELWVGFYKKGSGKRSVTYPEAVDEALCFGWIDGVRKRLDQDSYINRFSPRTQTSAWSAVNIKRAKELIEQGRMTPAGMAAFERRSEERAAIHSYERRNATLPHEHERMFRANRRAWAFFSGQPPSYRKAATWWVISARRKETQLKRLATLIEHSENQRRVPPLTPPQKSNAKRA
jgi:uncharacterized protein YdeI (YjbR/CyaY-like superfamily)